MILNGTIRRSSVLLPPAQDLAWYRGDAKSLPVRVKTIPAGRTLAALYFTAKLSASDPDSAAKIQKTLSVGTTTAGIASTTLDFAPADTTDAAVVPSPLVYEIVARLDNGDTYTVLTGGLTLMTRIPVTLATGVASVTVTAA